MLSLAREPVVGHLSSGRGLVVHLEVCRNLAELRERNEALIPVRWAAEVDGEYSVELRVEVEARKGVIAELAAEITDADANIERIIAERNAHLSTVVIALLVQDRVHLARIMRRLRRLTPVIGLAPNPKHLSWRTSRPSAPFIAMRRPQPLGPYAQATVRTAPPFTYPGKLALTPLRELREGFGAQLEQVFINLAAVAEAGGASLDDAVKFTVFLTDLANFGAVNEKMAAVLKPLCSPRRRTGGGGSGGRGGARRHPSALGRRLGRRTRTVARLRIP